jgi:hypothetical protein
MAVTIQAGPEGPASPRPVYDSVVDQTTTTTTTTTAAAAADVPTGTSPVAPPSSPIPTAVPATKAIASTPVPERSTADRLMRRTLRIPEERRPVPESDTHRIFGVSIFLSATRCLLSYIVLPLVLPFLGLAKGVGPWLGIPIGVLALTFDVLGIRRFWMADHHQRWLFSAIYAVVGTMVLSLLIIDIVDLVG